MDPMQVSHHNIKNEGDLVLLVDWGKKYLVGDGVEKNYIMSFKYFSLAAQRGDPTAQFQLGRMYAYGLDGIIQSYEEAAKYYRMAAAQGNSSAQFKLGVLFENGEGVTQSDEEAIKYYQMAADQGHA